MKDLDFIKPASVSSLISPSASHSIYLLLSSIHLLKSTLTKVILIKRYSKLNDLLTFTRCHAMFNLSLELNNVQSFNNTLTFKDEEVS